MATFVLAELSSFRNPNSRPLEDATVSSASHPLETSTLSPTPLAALLTSLYSASALGAGTLLLFGGYGKLRQLIGDGGIGGGGGTEEGGGKFYPKKRGEQVSALSVLDKAMSVMVPYFAALELGAVRTGTVVLGVAAGGLVMAGRSGDIKGMVMGKKGVLGAIVVGIVYDLWRSSSLENGLFSLGFPGSKYYEDTN